MPTEKRALDRTDYAILARLQKDARLSNKELATKVGLAPSSCLVRVQRLTEDGVIRGAHIDVDPAAVGIGLQAIIAIQLEQHGGSGLERFKERMLGIEEVMDVYYVGGSQDLLLHAAVRDSEHLRQVVVDKIATSDEVRHLETAIIFEHKRSPGVPLYER